MSRKLIFIDHSIHGPGIFDTSVEDTNGQHPIFCLCSKEVADEILPLLEKNTKEKLDFAERKRKFALTLQPFVDQYGLEMVKAFYSYWVEPLKSGKRFRQEAEKAWCLERRLQTWAKNNQNKIASRETKPAQQNVIGRQSEETVRNNMGNWKFGQP